MPLLYRAIFGKKNSDVARKSGVSAQTIAKWRKSPTDGGTRHPRFHTMKLVARAVGMRFELAPMQVGKAHVKVENEHGVN
jgi:DNA-binding phage protein